jgi:hypothetical protein
MWLRVALSSETVIDLPDIVDVEIVRSAQPGKATRRRKSSERTGMVEEARLEQLDVGPRP